MHLLTWLGVGAVALASIVLALSALIGLGQRVLLARARLRRVLGAHPFRAGEPNELEEATERTPRLVWPSLALLALATIALALAPREPDTALTRDAVTEACAAATRQASVPSLSAWAAFPSGPIAFQHGVITDGRTSEIRLSQVPTGLEVMTEDDGFVATIQGALSLDRAGPIAAASPSVARASVLNRGDHAILVVRWVAGHPLPFRIEVRERAIQVTVGR